MITKLKESLIFYSVFAKTSLSICNKNNKTNMIIEIGEYGKQAT